MGNVEPVTPPENKRGFAFYVKAVILAVVLLVVLSEIVVSQRAGTSFNMEMLDKLLDTLLTLLAPTPA